MRHSASRGSRRPGAPPGSRGGTRSAASAPAPAPAGVRERFSGTLQYVFGSDPGYSVDESFGGAIDAERERAERERAQRPSGIETHRL